MEQDIIAEAEAEAGGTFFKGVTDFMDKSISKGALEKVSIDNIKSTFQLPDNPFTRRLERGFDGLVAKVEGGLNV